MSSTVLHVSPHPDDELIGAPASLMALRDAGWTIVNFVCSLGRPAQRATRRDELLEAAKRTGFDPRVPEPPLSMSRGDDLEAAEERLSALLGEALDELRPQLVVSPHPHDAHHAHEAVGRAVRRVLAERTGGPRWWMWGLWGPLPIVTLGITFGEERMAEILDALGAYAGELERNDYRGLVRGRAAMNASLAPELLFGFGSKATGSEFVELLAEVVPDRERLLLGQARWLDAGEPFAEPRDLDASPWIDAASMSARIGLSDGR